MKTKEVYWVRFNFRLRQVFLFIVFLPFSLLFLLIYDLPKLLIDFFIDEWESAYKFVYQHWLIPKFRSKKAREVIADYGNLTVDEFCIKHQCTKDGRDEFFSQSQKALGIGVKK